jgi:hypothetical protein
MSQTPVCHFPEIKFHYYTIIPHRSEPLVLLLSGDDGWILPHFVPVEQHFGAVGHINRAMQAQLGIKVTVLRCVYHHLNRQKYLQRVYALENHSSSWNPPAWGRWVSRYELNQLKLAVPEHLDVLKAWFDEAEGVAIREGDVPWTIPGWFDLASGWIHEQLNRQRLGAISPIEQLKAWKLACVLRVKTTAGNVYFKATPALFAREPQLTQALTKYYPAHLPVVLAADFEKRWILMRDVGGKILQQVPDISLWEAALRRFAQIQIDSVQHLDSLIAQGWLDMRLDRLASQIHLLFQDALREPEIAQLLAFAPQLAALWEELAQLGVPHTLVHGDLSPRNIYVTGDNYIYFDWSDSCISHPFFDTVRFLYEIEMELTDVPDARTRLRNAYLEPWAVYEPVERLISAFERCSQTLVSLYQAILDRRLTANLEGSVKWESFAPGPFYIKRLLFQVATYLQLSLRGVY